MIKELRNVVCDIDNKKRLIYKAADNKKVVNRSFIKAEIGTQNNQIGTEGKEEGKRNLENQLSVNLGRRRGINEHVAKEKA